MTLLSHYTRREGLEGIVGTGTFWATDFLYLDDPLEFFYALRYLNEAAQEMVMCLIPPGKKKTTYDLNSAFESAKNQLKQTLQSSEGYGNLYVLSFAQERPNDENQRGIRRLWAEYAGDGDGYCLQFDLRDVNRMLDQERQRCNYEKIGRDEVRYGIDKNAKDFKDLSYQLSQRILLQVSDARLDIQLKSEDEHMWSDGDFYRHLMWYCAIHKDPKYTYQQEVRLFAYPAIVSDSRLFTGMAAKKQVLTRSEGNRYRRYIVLGERWKPRIMPRRIIVGTKADRDIGPILANCACAIEHSSIFSHSPMPEVVYEDRPIT
jgi:hypothetical protein